MSDTEGPHLDYLKEVVELRREELGLTQGQLRDIRGKYTGPSTTLMTKIENARTPAPRRDSLRKVDTALQWEQDSAFFAMTRRRPPITLESQSQSQAQVTDTLATIAIDPTLTEHDRYYLTGLVQQIRGQSQGQGKGQSSNQGETGDDGLSASAAAAIAKLKIDRAHNDGNKAG